MAQLSSTTINGNFRLSGTVSEETSGCNLWYNNSTGRLQYTFSGCAWASVGNLNVGRTMLAGAGTQNAGLAMAGNASPMACGCTEEFDGTSWSGGQVLNVARCGLAGAGTQNAGLAFAGLSPLALNPANLVVGCTEEYDGTTWTVGGSMIVPRQCLAGAGTQNAGLAFGGYSPTRSCTEEYDGSTWATGGALIFARQTLGGFGTQNEALAFGGGGGTTTEEYNGTSWTSGGSMIVGRTLPAGAGTQNAGLAFGGAPGVNISRTEEYNGTSWSNGGNMICGRVALAGAGTQTQALAFGGCAPQFVLPSEEYFKGVGCVIFIGQVQFPPYCGV